MKAIVIDEFGGPDVLNYREHPVPEFGDDQVLIRVKAAGVNPADWKIREGYVAQLFPHQLPLVLGWDMAGVIDSVGKNISSFKPGDEVYCFPRLPTVQHGTYAEFAPADSDMLATKPENLSFEQSATLPLVTLTAWQALVDFGELQAGQSLFVSAGAGGVGGMAIQIAKHLGARVCTTASAGNHDYLRELGADHIIDYNNENIDESVKAFQKDGVDLVFDCTGSEDVVINFNYVRKPGGRVATINGLVHTIPELEKNAELHNVTAKLVVVEPRGAQLGKLTKLFEREALRPLPVESYPLEDAGLALQKSEEGHVRGKLALIID
ncbi:MAG: zinc-binding dehydrogenase [Gammaproteobacteria bacterium]|nr:zinc-binding dehydrogenase [Gammaproteobacteria bacterium]